MQAEKITTHIQDGLERFIQQYRNSEKLKGITESFCQQKQDMEDALVGLFGRLDIDSMEGILLDKLGEIVGQERLGNTDEVYRMLLYARIAINFSRGTPNEIINIFKLITGYTLVDFREIFPAAIQIWGNGLEPDALILDFIVFALEKALPAGVSLDSFGIFDEDNPFYFEEVDGIIDTDGRGGYGDETDPDIGGKLGKELYVGGI